MLSLIELKNYIKDKGIVDLCSITEKFHTTADDLEPLLIVLENKQLIKKANKQQVGCGKTCGKCAISKTILYVWINQEGK